METGSTTRSDKPRRPCTVCLLHGRAISLYISVRENIIIIYAYSSPQSISLFMNEHGPTKTTAPPSILLRKESCNFALHTLSCFRPEVKLTEQDSLLCEEIAEKTERTDVSQLVQFSHYNL